MTIQENDLSKETVKASKMCNFCYFFFLCMLGAKISDIVESNSTRENKFTDSKRPIHFVAT